MSRSLVPTTTVITPWIVLLAVLASPPAPAAPGGGNSGATITATFTASCRGFLAHSTKDISHVELHYLDGRSVKDESVASRDFAIEAGAGDELAFAIVKSGTTSRDFACGPANAAPTADLEINTPAAQSLEGCGPFFAGGLICEQSTPRIDWTDAGAVPDEGGSDSGLFHWGCGSLTDLSQCSFTFTFRGIGSTDPDGDIMFWSIDFGDGTSASGNWSAAPPAEVTHEYSISACLSQVCVVTLKVTDSSAQTASASLRMVFLDQTPD